MMPSNSDSAEEKIIVLVDRDLAGLIPRFMDNRRNDIVTLGMAVALDDYETVGSLAHGLKRCSAGYGFHEITEIGVGLEQAAKANDRQEIQTWIDRLAEYLTRVEIVYE